MSLLAAPQPKLLIADATGIVRRVNEAVKGADELERVEGVLKSSWESILRGLREHEPTHFFGAFDPSGPCWRHQVDPNYKLHRTPPSAELTSSMPGFIEKLCNTGLRSMAMPGQEADDLINTLSLRAVARGFEVIVLSSDKDVLKLIAAGIQIYDHFSSEIRDQEWVKNKYGVNPAQMTDFLSMTGDDTDGIPGIAGVGKTRAARLLNEFGSMDAMFDGADAIPGKLGISIRSSREVAEQSRRLVQMRDDLQLGLSPRDLALPAALISYIAEAPAPRLVRTSRSSDSALPHRASQHPGPQDAAPSRRRLRA